MSENTDNSITFYSITTPYRVYLVAFRVVKKVMSSFVSAGIHPSRRIICFATWVEILLCPDDVTEQNFGEKQEGNHKVFSASTDSHEANVSILFPK